MDSAILKEMTAALVDMGSVLPESFCNMTLRRLESLGCQVDASQIWNLAFCVRKSEVEVLDYCHIDLIPVVLHPMLCDRACGRYLYDRKQSGTLDIESIDLSGVLTSLSEGDVKVSFNAATSDEAKLDALLGLMMNTGKGQLSCYRKVRW
ncbi:MAG: hypothetical protein KH452_05950 [Clostridiales bacterium]|nr:hypothetical protein [Clostridiales bacterium]